MKIKTKFKVEDVISLEGGIHIKKNTVISDGTKRWILLQDSMAHGCPFVQEINKKNIKIGEEHARTLYFHTDDLYHIIGKIEEEKEEKNKEKTNRTDLMVFE